VSATDLCATCGGDCPVGDCETLAEANDAARAAGFDGLDYEPCEHDCDEDCEDYQGFNICSHSHCMNCGGCGCPGYCDDHRTYNLRPDETGGTAGDVRSQS
jgi:hypothetical protein